MHWFNDLVGILIVLLVILFPVLNRMINGKRKDLEDEEDLEFIEDQAQLQGDDAYTTQGVTQKDHPELEKSFNEIEKRHLEIHIEPDQDKMSLIENSPERGANTRLESCLKRHSSLKKMVIASEILGKPVVDRLSIRDP